MHNNVVLDDNQLPDVIQDYNFLKDGVDSLNRLVAYYSTACSTRCWSLKLFFNTLDIAALNSYLLYILRYPQWNISKKKVRRRLYLRELAEALARPLIQNRFVDRPKSFQRSIERARKRVYPEDAPQNAADNEGQCRYCEFCVQARRVKSTCNICHKYICPVHTHIICPDC